MKGKEQTIRLYHATSARHLEPIKRSGLLPQGGTGTSTWEESPSRKGLVYLTDRHCVHFLAHHYDEETELMLVEVDVPLDGLLPDEDFLVQDFLRRGDELDEARAAADPWTNRRRWRDSLRELGNVTHDGPVPPVMIGRIVLLRGLAVHTVLSLSMEGSLVPLVDSMNAGRTRVLQNLTRHLIGRQDSCPELLHQPPGGVPVELRIPKGHRTLVARDRRGKWRSADL